VFWFSGEECLCHCPQQPFARYTRDQSHNLPDEENIVIPVTCFELGFYCEATKEKTLLIIVISFVAGLRINGPVNTLLPTDGHQFSYPVWHMRSRRFHRLEPHSLNHQRIRALVEAGGLPAVSEKVT